MKALVVTFFHVPWTVADQTGVQRRFAAFLHALHRTCSEITLLHIVPAAQIEAAGSIEELSRSQSLFWGVPVRIALVPRRVRRDTAWTHYGAGIFDAAGQPALSPFGGSEVAEAVGRHLDEEPDLVFAHAVQAVIPILRSKRRVRRLVVDFVDVEHRVLFRQAFSAPRYLGKSFRLLHVPALLALERRAAAASRLTLVCSEPERAYLRKLGFGDVVQMVPNALPLPSAPPGVVRDRTVLFLGDMKNLPNHFAAERAATRIWPLVRAAVPDARLLVCGFGSDRLPSANAGLPGVEHLGFVEDLDGLYARSRVVCCPVMTGGGTRLKLVEAAAYARPIVSTRMGAEGLDYADGREALLCDDDAGFAAACARLLQDDQMCQQLGQAARAVMAAKYDVRQVEDRIAQLIQQVLA